MLDYSSTIKTRAFLYLELKKASGLALEGHTASEIKDIAKNKNIFLVNSENRNKEISSTITKRIKALDEFLQNKIVNGSLDTGKQVALYAILKTDRLFFEFMQEVYREKYLLRDYMVTDKDFTVFFRRKAEQNEKVVTWKDYTFYKLQQVYKRILFEAGFAKKKVKHLEITKPIIEKDLADHLLNKGEAIYLQAMLGDI